MNGFLLEKYGKKSPAGNIAYEEEIILSKDTGRLEQGGTKMSLSVEDVYYIAKLAKIYLTPEQAQKMVKEFESILSHFEAINKFDLSEVQPDLYSEDTKPVLRKDETSVFPDKKKLLQNAKSMSDTYIKVPKIIE